MKIRSSLLLSLTILPLLLSGCMTMGWGGYHGPNQSRTGNQNQILVKERQIENYTLVAEFPSAVIHEEVRFALEIEGGEASKGSISESISLQISKQNGDTVEKTFTKLQPDHSLSTASRFVFPYRFEEAGTYEISFLIEDTFGEELESPYTISTTLPVSQSYNTNHHDTFNSVPWIMAGGAVMTGLMIWMMAN